VTRENECEEELLACDAEPFEDVAIGGVDAGLRYLSGFPVLREQASHRSRTTAGYGTLDAHLLARGPVAERKGHTALFGRIVYDLLGADLAQGATRQSERDGFDERRLACSVAALRLVVGIVPEYERRRTFGRRIVQRAEGAYIGCGDMFQIPHDVRSILLR